MPGHVIVHRTQDNVAQGKSRKDRHRHEERFSQVRQNPVLMVEILHPLEITSDGPGVNGRIMVSPELTCCV